MIKLVWSAATGSIAAFHKWVLGCLALSEDSMHLFRFNVTLMHNIMVHRHTPLAGLLGLMLISARSRHI